MPRALPSSANTERAFYADMRQYPQDPSIRLIFADWRDDHGGDYSAEVVRAVEVIRKRCPRLHLAPPDQLADLRGKELLNDECEETALALRGLLAADPSTLTQRQLTAVEAGISARLGRPGRAQEVLNPLDEHNLRFQYDLQRTLLASLDLPIGDDRFAEIRDRIHQMPALRREIERGRTLLLLAPRIPFVRAIAAFEQGLRRNAHLLPKGRLQPVYVNERYQEEGLLYNPESFDDHCGGQTEEEWMREQEMDILLVAPAAKIPAAQRNQSADEALRQRRNGEGFLTPQSYILLSLSLLELRGEILDRDIYSLLPGSCFPSFRGVPNGCWDRDRRRAYVGWDYPGYHSGVAGTRAAVRVV